MRISLFLSLTVFFALFVGCNENNHKEENGSVEQFDVAIVLKGSKDIPAIVFYVTYTNYPMEGNPEVYLAVWPDGRFISSTENNEIGEYCFTGKIDVERIDRFFDCVNNQGLFDRYKYATGDSLFDSGESEGIRLDYKGRKLHLSTIYDLWERTHPNDVVVADGILVLEGKSRSEVLADEPEEWIQFRKDWEFLRNQCNKLLPVKLEKRNKYEFEAIPGDIKYEGIPEEIRKIFDEELKL